MRYELGDRARKMRNAPTEPEKRLWRHLSNSQLGYKFRRQSVIGHYIVDFLCPSKALIVEVDGDTHELEADAQRDANLKRLGYRVIRFTNMDVMTNMAGILEAIVDAVYLQPPRWPHPNPSPEGEGLEENSPRS